MSDTVQDLLEQLERLAGYVRHQGEAARDGVPASPDHLLYLAKATSLAVQQLATAIEARTTNAATGRHAWLRGTLAGKDVTVRGLFRTEQARQMAIDCAAPSVHLLRRMQIAGVR